MAGQECRCCPGKCRENSGSWHDAADLTGLLPTMCAMSRPALHCQPWWAWPACAGRWKNASKRPREKSDSTTMRCVAGTAGIGISPWPWPLMPIWQPCAFMPALLLRLKKDCAKPNAPMETPAPADRARDSKITVAFGLAVCATIARRHRLVALAKASSSCRTRLPLPAPLQGTMIYNCSTKRFLLCHGKL